MTIEFNLYSSLGCHLCEQAYALCEQLNIIDKVKVVDIVDDEQLVEQYGVHIPVLERLSDQSKLYWPFSLSQIKELL
jgi:hypothetical protein